MNNDNKQLLQEVINISEMYYLDMIKMIRRNKNDEQAAEYWVDKYKKVGSLCEELEVDEKDGMVYQFDNDNGDVCTLSEIIETNVHSHDVAIIEDKEIIKLVKLGIGESMSFYSGRIVMRIN